jgi:iron complex outermembrane receptor protein
MVLWAAPAVAFAQTPPQSASMDEPMTRLEMMAEMAEAQAAMEPEDVPVLEEVIVTAAVDRFRFQTLQGVGVLDGEELRLRLEATLGETLAREPGISSTFFGPGASRPIIRGQGGERIRVLNDGIGNFDVSTTSADHVVAADPLSAERVEIVRGPAALLYGDSAAGGVVNVVEGRIPRRRQEGWASELLGYVGSNADARNGSAETDVGLGESWVAHADAFWREQGAYAAGGGRSVVNSALETSGAALGLSWINDRGFAGAAVNAFESRYGIPGDVAAIEAEQTRVDFAGEQRVDSAGIRSVRVRAGWADYEHLEVDDQGVVATTFANEEYEARVDVRHLPIGPLTGAVGLQTRGRKFAAVGFEAFVPPSEFRQWGAFLFERAERGRFAIEGGLRYTSSELETEGFSDPSQFVPRVTRTFDTIGASIGASFEPTENAIVGLSLFRTARAPALEELYANGPHAATGSYEIGDPTLDEETAVGVELTARRAWSDRLVLELNLFLTEYEGFIVERETGETRLGFPVFRFGATDARFSGGEIVVEAALASGTWGELRGDILLDAVRAQDTGLGEDLPRIPPARLITGLDWAGSGRFRGRAELIFAADQDRTGPLERSTPGYVFFNVSATIDLSPTVELQLRGANLTDEFARTHTSFLRDAAPLPGRDLRVLLRARF